MRASGAITSGPGGGGLLDDDALATAEDIVDALDRGRTTKEVSAIVLRIDSPGGTYPAADAMADGVARARAAGKPVIVSMGDIAASGGYLAAVRADVIVAQPTTITGSIGVFGIWPVASELLDTLGIRVERRGSAPMPACIRSSSRRRRRSAPAIDRELDAVYADFTRQVGEARKLDAGRLDAAARGRVFTGVDARQRRPGRRAGRPAARAQHRQGQGRHRRGPADRGAPFPRRRRPLAEDRRPRDAPAGVDARGPTMRAPREIREALARFGIAGRPGNVACRPCRRSGARDLR